MAVLFSLFVLGCIHLLSTRGWSAILFVADPLPASTIGTREGETLMRRTRRKPAYQGMTKNLQRILRQLALFWDSAHSTDEQHMGEGYSIFSKACVICVSLALWVHQVATEWSVSSQWLPDGT